MPGPRREDVATEPLPPTRVRARAQRWAVVLWEGGSKVLTLPERGAVTFGRSTQCEVAIDHASVSRKHATLHTGDALTLEDLGSANGTRVRGERLERGERVELSPGDVVELGSALLILQAPGSPAQPSASAHPRKAPAAIPEGEIVADPAMQQLYRLVEMAARTPMSLFLRGETGVGKDVLAFAAHRFSGRAGKAFVRLSPAMSESALERELDAARGGTLYAPEVGELSASLQSAVLHALEARGAEAFRVVAATQGDPEALVASGQLRKDLFFRLNGISVEIPPLRRRPADLEPLAEHFAARAASRLNRPALRFSAEAMDLLRAHDWPGNVRELENAIGQAVVACAEGRTLEPQHFPKLTAAPAKAAAPSRPAPGLKADVGNFERDRIAEALQRCSGNQTRAAAMLGISRRTLLNRLDLYGLPRPRK